MVSAGCRFHDAIHEVSIHFLYLTTCRIGSSIEAFPCSQESLVDREHPEVLESNLIILNFADSMMPRFSQTTAMSRWHLCFFVVASFDCFGGKSLPLSPRKI